MTMPPFLVFYFGLLYLTVTRIDGASSGVIVPRQRDIRVEKNEWTSILASIESRLRNLDNLYTSQLTPTLETRLEHFQNRISGMEVKMLRIETLLTTKLDRMSDNMSSRHFRDDMVQTDLFRKMETAYDGITHKLAYMDRKYDNGFLKTQGKVEVIAKKIENIDESLATKFDSVDSQFADLASDLDEIKTSINSLEKNSNLDRQGNVSGQNQDIPGLSARTAQSSLSNNLQNSTEILQKEDLVISKNITEKAIDKLSEEMETLLNDYASKVSDLGEQLSLSDGKIVAHLDTIENVTNSTKNELLNGFRKLFVRMGKMINDEEDKFEVIESKSLSRLERKIDANFEKMATVHHEFVERCDRLKLDDSEMESTISEILNKLIDNYEKTTRDQRNLLRKVEGTLANHDVNSKRDLYQVHTNMVAVYEQSKKDAGTLAGQMKQLLENLEALFALMEKNFGYYSVVKRYIPKDKELIEYIRSLERALNFTKTEQMKMYDTYKATVETLMTLAETGAEENKIANSIVKNVTQNIENLKENFDKLMTNWNENVTSDIMSSVAKTYQLVKENNQRLGKLAEININKYNNTNSQTSVNNGKNQSGTDIDKLIKEIFFNNSTSPSTEKNIVTCLDFDIDVRFDGDKFNKSCKNVSQKIAMTTEPSEPNNKTNSQISMNNNNNQLNATGTETVDRIIEKIFFNSSTIPSIEKETVSSLDFAIDVRFDGKKFNESSEITSNQNITATTTTSETDCLDFNIDINFKDDENSSSHSPRKCKTGSNTNGKTTTQIEENNEQQPESKNSNIINCSNQQQDVESSEYDNTESKTTLCKIETSQKSDIQQSSEQQNIRIIDPTRGNSSTSNEASSNNTSTEKILNSTLYINLDNI